MEMAKPSHAFFKPAIVANPADSVQYLLQNCAIQKSKLHNLYKMLYNYKKKFNIIVQTPKNITSRFVNIDDNVQGCTTLL